MRNEGVASVSTLAGYNFVTDGTGAPFGMNLISLKAGTIEMAHLIRI
jgi:hypothetical protein